MPRSCSICTHDQNAIITRGLTAGDSIRSISSRFKLSPAAVQRHLTRCLRIFRRVEASKESALEETRTSADFSSRFASDDGRCRSCGQLVGESEDGRLEPKDLIKRAERTLWMGENVAASALESDDLRLVLQAMDRIRSSLDTLLRVHGLMGTDAATVNDNRSVNVFAGWEPAEVRRVLAALSGGKDSADCTVPSGTVQKAITGTT
jgi:hypothetical protein